MIFNPQHETLPRERLAVLQLDFSPLVERIKQNGAALPRAARRAEPEDVASVEDLAGFPFTRKDDLRDTYPLGMFAVPARRSRGSMPRRARPGSRPSSATPADRAGQRARLAMAGAEPGMTLHNAYGYGLFTGGSACTAAESDSGSLSCRSPAA